MLSKILEMLIIFAASIDMTLAKGAAIVDTHLAQEKKQVVFPCYSNQAPIWTKIGKTTEDVQNLAIGKSKLPQYSDER